MKKELICKKCYYKIDTWEKSPSVHDRKLVSGMKCKLGYRISSSRAGCAGKKFKPKK